MSGNGGAPKTCREDDLVALARRELSPARAKEVEAHTQACDSCRRELDWLRAERNLFARHAERAPTPPASQWSAIADRIAIATEQNRDRALREETSPAPRRALRRAWIVGGAGALVAVAAVTLLLVLPQGRGRNDRPGGVAERAIDAGVTEPTPGPSNLEMDEDDARARRRRVWLAIERAENEYARAIEVLDLEYQELRASLPGGVARVRDAEVRRLHAELDAIRGAPGDDLEYRLRALQASAAYVRSMQKLVLAEAQPAEEVLP